LQPNNNLIKLQQQLDQKVSRYKDVKVSDLKILVNEHNKYNKASYIRLARKMLGISGNQFVIPNSGIELNLKTIRLTGNNMAAEPMSFTNVDFDKWVGANNWEDSPLYHYFSKKYFAFFIFKQFPSGIHVEDNEMTFSRIKVWKMSEYDLQHGLRDIWAETCRLLNDNELKITPVMQKNGVINKNNLPAGSFNYLGHLRPGGKNGKDTVLLPTGQYIVKQRFWFNQKYVKEIINL
jgi:hypothetical protein